MKFQIVVARDFSSFMTTDVQAVLMAQASDRTWVPVAKADLHTPDLARIKSAWEAIADLLSSSKPRTALETTQLISQMGVVDPKDAVSEVVWTSSGGD